MIKDAKKVVVFLSIFLLIGLGSFNVYAQEDPGDDVDIPDIPLDGGLSILLAAGAAYGGKKLYDAKKKRHDDE
jgi:hypothetical protein